jgi:hypothetical protein
MPGNVPWQPVKAASTTTKDNEDFIDPSSAVRPFAFSVRSISQVDAHIEP